MATRNKKVQYLNGRRASNYSTNGSVAYDAGYASGGAVRTREGAAPRTRTQQQGQTIARPRVKVREKGEASLFSIVGVAAIAVVAILLLISYAQLLMVSDSVVALQSEQKVLQAEQAKLLTEYELSINLEEIEAEVLATGAMVKPQSEQIIYIDTYEGDDVVFYEDESAVKGIEGIFSGLKEIWQNITEYF